MSERLLFIDFDGVLHPEGCDQASYLGNLSKLESLAAYHSANLRLVISSSWRFHHSWDELADFFPESLRRLLIGTTGSAIPGCLGRYEEIQNFLADYRGWADWRALDDAVSQFPENCPNLVPCNGLIGIGAEEVLALTAWLRSDSCYN